MLRSFSVSTPTRQRHAPQPLQRTPSAASSTSDRRLSSPKLLRQLSSPSEFFKRSTPVKEKISRELQRALDKLQLRDLEALETQILSTRAFLEPWTEYRDSFLLLQPNGMPRSTLPGQIKREDILHYYTFYSENKLRYDGRADPDNEKEYNPNMTGYHVINKSRWGAADYDKLLYVWLLQTFKVGKHKSPYGFKYFECRNICTAWEEVIVPIVEAVRSDYNTKGRYHYGRLAKFIEEASPSRLAFPEGNVSPEQQFVRRSIQGSEKSPHRSVGEMHPVTGLARNWKKPWNGDEVELRQAYPQYGQLVERPKPKTSFPEWIEEQKAILQRRKEERAAVQHTMALNHLEGTPIVAVSPTDSSTSHNETAPELPFLRKLREAQARDSGRARRQTQFHYEADQREVSRQSYLSVGTNSPVRMSSMRKSSDGVYSSIRSSNPHLEDPRYIYGHPSERTAPGASHQRSATVPVEIKPSPLEQPFNNHQHKKVEVSSTYDDENDRRPSYEGTGYPSYDGNGYAKPWLPTLKEVNSIDSMSNQNRSAEKTRATRTRIPSPIEIPPNEATRKYHPIVEKAVVRAETTPMTYDPAPAIPSKNPKRYSDERRRGEGQLPGQIIAENMLGRIVSRENIRAALEDSDEDQEDAGIHGSSSPGDTHAFAGIGGRGLNTGESPKLQTYSSHLFPRGGSISRNQTPVGKNKKMRGSNEGNGQYEMRSFGSDVSDDHSRAFL